MSDELKVTAIEALSTNILDTRFEDFDQATLENAKNRIIDVIGCMIAGANDSANSVLIDLVKDWGGKKEATILVHGVKAPAQNVAMVNSIMARSFDFEPTRILVEGKMSPTHIIPTTAMTAITLGEVTGINGKELITAMLVGDDVTSRVYTAAGGSDFGGGQAGPGRGGGGAANAFGATAIAGRLLGLNKLQMRNAFGILLNQLSISLQMIIDGAATYTLPYGLSARNGIFSAQLAKAGWTGVEDALLSQSGYFNLYTGGCIDPGVLTRDLGKKYYAEVGYKRYPSCGATQEPIECALAIVAKHDIKGEDIEEVTLRIPRAALGGYCDKPFRPGDFPHCAAIWSYRYTVANALLRKSSKPEHFLDDAIRDPQINALISKMKVEELPRAEGERVQVKLRMKDRQEYSETDVMSNPMTKDEIIAKFRANVDFSQTVTNENAEKLLSLLEKLEELDSVNRMVELLVS